MGQNEIYKQECTHTPNGLSELPVDKHASRKWIKRWEEEVRDGSGCKCRTYYAVEVVVGDSDELLDEESVLDDGVASSLEVSELLVTCESARLVGAGSELESVLVGWTSSLESVLVDWASSLESLPVDCASEPESVLVGCASSLESVLVDWASSLESLPVDCASGLESLPVDCASELESVLVDWASEVEFDEEELEASAVCVVLAVALVLVETEVVVVAEALELSEDVLLAALTVK
jgi:hypothetical protein